MILWPLQDTQASCPAVCQFTRVPRLPAKKQKQNKTKKKHRCDAQPGVYVCVRVHDSSVQNAKHPHLSSYSERCHGDTSLARVLRWSALTLGDLWHLGHGQGQKVSNGQRATRALPWLALWHARCPLHLRRSPPSLHPSLPVSTFSSAFVSAAGGSSHCFALPYLSR